MLSQKYVSVKGSLKQSPDTQDSFTDLYFLQNHLIEETEALVSHCFNQDKADLINYDALQAICFLVITDQHIDLGSIELKNCLDLLGVHPIILQDTVKILKKIYRIPKNADLLAFIRIIGPILLKKHASQEFG